MPYPWLAAKENAYNDISHDQVLHHGVSAFANRAGAKPIPMKLKEITPVGYKVGWVFQFFLSIEEQQQQQHGLSACSSVILVQFGAPYMT